MITAPPRHPAHAWEIFPVFNPAAPAAMHAPTAVLITSSLPLTYSDPHCNTASAPQTPQQQVVFDTSRSLDQTASCLPSVWCAQRERIAKTAQKAGARRQRATFLALRRQDTSKEAHGLASCYRSDTGVETTDNLKKRAPHTWWGFSDESLQRTK